MNKAILDIKSYPLSQKCRELDLQTGSWNVSELAAGT